jgi:iron complex outermembrane receptor protein
VFEGSPQFTGFVPTYDMVDAQLNYKVSKIKSVIKIGASNILGFMPLFDNGESLSGRTVFNNLNYQVYGGPFVGRLAYISITTDIKPNKNKSKKN